MICYRSGSIGYVHVMCTCHVKRARVEGIGNVFPKQKRDFGNNFSSKKLEMSNYVAASAPPTYCSMYGCCSREMKERQRAPVTQALTVFFNTARQVLPKSTAVGLPLESFVCLISSNSVHIVYFIKTYRVFLYMEK